MAKLTKKSYKRKRVLMGLALFMSIALVSTGFAAWVISSSVEKNGDGNVSAGTVSDKSLELVINNAEDLGTIKFEPKKEDNSGRVRYEGNDSDNYESLSVTVTGQITKNPEYLGDLTIQLVELNETGDAALDLADSKLAKAAAANKNYISLPECFYNPIKLNAQGSTFYNTTDNTFSYKITFGWGSAFGGVNPGYYYDGLDGEGNEYNQDDTEGQAIKKAGLDITDKAMIDTLVDLRNVVYGTNETMEEQNKNGTKGPQYRVIVKATTN